MPKSASSTPRDGQPSRSAARREAAPAQAARGRKTQVRRSGIHGKGMYALRDLEPGEVVLEYKGERITWKEAERRHARKKGDPFHTFYFQTEHGKVIDGGGVGGNSARWINHSCEPNCETQEDDDGRVFVVAIAPIAAGEELFYDYALEIDAPLTAALKKDYACLCGSAQCRGTMLKTRRKKAAAPKAKPAGKAQSSARKREETPPPGGRKQRSEGAAPPVDAAATKKQKRARKAARP